MRSSLCTKEYLCFILQRYSSSLSTLSYLLPHTAPLFSLPFATVRYNSPAATLPSVLKQIFQHLWVVLAALVEEVVVVFLAYFSFSKSSLMQRSTQPNQKEENILPHLEEDRENSFQIS